MCEKIKSNVNRVKKTWGVITTILLKIKNNRSNIFNIGTDTGNTNEPPQKKIIAEEWNTYFAYVGPSLTNKMCYGNNPNLSTYLGNFFKMKIPTPLTLLNEVQG